MFKRNKRAVKELDVVMERVVATNSARTKNIIAAKKIEIEKLQADIHGHCMRLNDEYADELTIKLEIRWLRNKINGLRLDIRMLELQEWAESYELLRDIRSRELLDLVKSSVIVKK